MQNAPIYNAKYKKEESEVKALMELIKRVAVVTTTEKKYDNIRKSVTLEHCFGSEETSRRKKHQGGASVPLRKEEKIT